MVGNLLPASLTHTTRYHRIMDKDDHLQRHLDLCRRMYLRMLADGTWPWKDDHDSTISDGMIESKDPDDDDL